jgi:hypothetical protein
MELIHPVGRRYGHYNVRHGQRNTGLNHIYFRLRRCQAPLRYRKSFSPSARAESRVRSNDRNPNDDRQSRRIRNEKSASQIPSHRRRSCEPRTMGLHSASIEDLTRQEPRSRFCGSSEATWPGQTRKHVEDAAELPRHSARLCPLAPPNSLEPDKGRERYRFVPSTPQNLRPNT